VDLSDPHIALHHMETGVLVLDPELRIVWANRHGADLLGAAPREILRLTPHDARWNAIHPDGTPFTGEEHPVAVVRRTGAPVRGVVMGVARPRSADRVWLRVSALPVRGAEGRMAGVVATLADMSAAQSAQLDLEEMNAHLGELVERRTHDLARLLRMHRESEELHRAVIRSMAEGVVVHDGEGAIMDANPAAEEILGLSLAQIQGRHPVNPLWELADEDGAPLPAEEIPSEVTRRTGQAVTDRILQVRRPGGERRWLSVSTDPVRLEGESSPRGVVATFNDITAEREARVALEESRTFLEQVMAAVPGVMVRSVRAEGGEERVTFASDDLKAMLGITPGELVADTGNLRQRVHPADLQRLRDDRDRLIRDGVGSEISVRISGANDEWRWIRIHTAPPIRTAEGTVFHATLFDITEERRIEQGLRQAQRQEALGVLAGGIAHNFNNMLAVILPSLELASDLGGAQVAEALVDAQRATEGASALVRQLLRLARKEGSGAVEHIEMSDLVEGVVALARRIFSRRIHLEFGAAPGPFVVLGRRDELEQVVLNLLINARDAVEESPDPRILARLDAREGMARMEVRDNGCGMDEALARRLGQPFFTTKEPGRGTGLGLATALGIVGDLGGSLRWSSPGPGGGSTFTLELPLAEDTSARPPPVTPAPRPVETEVRGARVLVVDDEPMVLKSVARLLRKLVPEIVTVPDGEEALRLAGGDGAFDAVLVDLSMPGMDGGELTRRLKARWPDLPVLIMTGFVREADDISAADGIIAKPFSGQELRDTLRPWLM
jgi:PAS domain S-box-containing protein